jgi:hypothetical protein
VPSEERENLFYLDVPRKVDGDSVVFGLVSDSQVTIVITIVHTFLIVNLKAGFVTFNDILQSVSTRHKPDILIHGGDLVQFGGDLKDWQLNWFSILSRHLINPLKQITPIFYAKGNHDFVDNHYTAFYPPYRALTFANIRFIILDSNRDSNEQYEWFIDQLNSKQQQQPQNLFFNFFPQTQNL